MATSTILNFINTPKASTHYGEYSYDVSGSLMKEIKIKKNPPFFISMATAAKFVLPCPVFFGLSHSWNEISPKNRNQLDKLCHSCHGNKKGGI
jgi:hypothetical protein